MLDFRNEDNRNKQFGNKEYKIDKQDCYINRLKSVVVYAIDFSKVAELQCAENVYREDAFSGSTDYIAFEYLHWWVKTEDAYFERGLGTEIWSVGVILCYLVTGKHPFAFLPAY